jgi:Ice-binding-like
MDKSRIVTLLALITAVVAASWPAGAFAAGEPRLGTGLNFTVLAGQTITNTGPTVITGNLGLSPGNASSVTGFPPGTVTAVRHAADAVALQAKNDLVTAYNDAANAPTTSDLTGKDLGGMNLTPGVYRFSSSAQLTGPLTLSGNGVFIFQIGSALTTASGSTVLLNNGAQACSVWWQVGSSATLGSASQFQGNLMALSSISMVTGANILTGRALARNGALTLQTNRITPPAGGCTVGSTAPSGGVAATAPSGAVAGSTAVGLPNTGGPARQPGFPWLPVVVAGAIGAILFGLRRRTNRTNS